MFQNVVLPIDLNHDASWKKALPIAAGMAGGDGTLHILGIVHDLGAASISAYLPKDFEKHQLEQMQADLVAFRDANVPEGTRAEVHVGHGHIPETVVKLVADLAADAIVMASHPPDELRHLLVGSYAEKVLRHTSVPMMVVR